MIKYKLKNGKIEEIKNKYKLNYISRELDMNNGYISQILNGRSCPKKTAYSICKVLDDRNELEDLFEEVIK